ncbi:MAG TPA: type II secretion system F family protein [Clostridiales bacterium]|nr:type II secretion system F family protein [Clostridiales bacterium]
MREIIFYIVSALLVISTVVLSFLIAEQIVYKKIIHIKLTNMNKKLEERLIENEIKKYTTKLDTKKGFIERIEINLIHRTNVNKKFRYIQINAYILLIFMLIIFLLSIKPAYRMVNWLPTSIIISAIISMIPVVILDMIGKINSQKTAQQLAGFITILNRWCSVKDDIFYAFEKSVESLDYPLRTYIAEMVIQIKSGIDPEIALDILQIKVNNEQFSEFVINIKQNIKSRGDTKKLLTNMESQFYKIKNEMDRRKISTLTDRVVIYIIMGLVFVVATAILKYSLEGRAYYLYTEQGRILLAIFSLVYAVGIYLTMKITQFRY